MVVGCWWGCYHLVYVLVHVLAISRFQSKERGSPSGPYTYSTGLLAL